VIALFIVGAVVAINLASKSGLLDTGSLTGTEQVWKAVDGRLECLKDQTPQEVIQSTINNKLTFTCGDKYLVDNCEVIVYCGDTSLINSECKGFYRLDGGNKQSYSVSKNNQKTLLTLTNGQSIYFETGIDATNEDKTKVVYRFYPYRLFTIESGKKVISSSSDCNLANQDQLQRNKFEYGDWKVLDKGGILNYFVSWTLTEGAIYTFNGQEVVCSANALYGLERIKLADSSTKNRQGEFIKNVECCPYQSKNCDAKTFTFITQKEADNVAPSCTYSYQCENAGDPWTSSSVLAKKEVCEGGLCVEKSFNIQCNSDAKCRQLYGEGYGCDLSFDNFGKCIKIGQIEQARCGDGVCQTGETKENCPSDCTLECPEGFKVITLEKKVNCIVGWPIYLGCDKQVEQKCDAGTTNWLLWIVVIVASLVIYIGFLRPILKGTKIGRILP
jgi:hypothetical protein